MYLSYQLSTAERNYHTTERECLAIIRSLEEVRWLVQGSKHPIQLYTDHEALVSILKKDDARGRIAGWQYKLSEYDFNICHVSGKILVVADGLSRISGTGSMPARPNEQEEVPLLSFPIIAKPREPWSILAPLLKDFESCDWYHDEVVYMTTGHLPDTESFLDPMLRRRTKLRAAKYSIEDGQLYYRERDGRKARCLLPHQIAHVLVTLHEAHGHFASHITTKRCVGHFYWPSRARDIANYCLRCEACQLLGPLRPSASELPVVQFEPRDVIAVDWLGEISPNSKRGNKYIIVEVDFATRWPNAKAYPSHAAKDSIDHLELTSQLFGYPGASYSDNGSHFKGDYGKFLAHKGIKQLLISPGYPQANGLAEVHVRIIRHALQACVAANPDLLYEWDEALDKIVLPAIRSRPMREFGNYSPAQLMLGYQPTLHGDMHTLSERLRMDFWADQVNRNAANASATPNWEVRLAVMDEMREDINGKRIARVIRRHDESDPAFRTPAVGDLVLVRDYKLDGQHGEKLSPRWHGPWKVVSLSKNERSVNLEHVATSKTARHHMNNVKLFFEQNPEWVQQPPPMIDVIAQNIQDMADTVEEAAIAHRNVEAITDALSDNPALQELQYWTTRMLDLNRPGQRQEYLHYVHCCQWWP